jgi:glycolate oxidase FAD binding subunit
VSVAVAHEPSSYALGGRTPATVHAPRDADAVAALLRASDDARAAVVFFGGNTLQALGNAPARYDVAIDLRGLDRVVDYEPRDLAIGAEAGVTIATLNATLAKHGQFVPLDAPRASLATVGGTLAAGWLGPRRATYGRPRDFVLGTTVALADGTIAHAGGMVVKNATGYDLSKLYVGSLGTLAAIVRANLRTFPLPAARRVAIATLPERTRAHAIANVRALDVEPVAALAIAGFPNEIDGRDGAEGRLLLLFEGSERTVERSTRDLRSALGAAGVPETRLVDREAAATFERAVDAYVATLGTRSVTYRSAGLPSDAAARAARFARAARASELVLETIEDIRTGDVIARISGGLTVEFAERLARFETERRESIRDARILAGPQHLRDLLDAWCDAPPALEKMRALKERFDPRFTLAPARFVGGL